MDYYFAVPFVITPLRALRKDHVWLHSHVSWGTFFLTVFEGKGHFYGKVKLDLNQIVSSHVIDSPGPIGITSLHFPSMSSNSTSFEGKAVNWFPLCPRKRKSHSTVTGDLLLNVTVFPENGDIDDTSPRRLIPADKSRSVPYFYEPPTHRRTIGPRE